MRTPRWSGRAAARDGLFLATAVVLSCAWYVPRLGFYSDDWAFVGRYATASEQSIGGFFAASFSSQHAMRPVQVWLCALLYRLFGLAPLGYHVFNSALLVLIAVLVYAIARELRIARTIAVAVALVYALLPSYSTDRFWYVAFAITLSMTACLAGMFADLRAAVAPVRAGIAWKTLSVAAFLVSALSYEVALPLFLLAPVLMIWQVRNSGGARRTGWLASLVAIDLILLAGAAVFKLETTVRLGAPQGLAVQMAAILRQAIDPALPYGHYGLNVFSALRVHAGDYGVGLSLYAASLARHAPAAVRWLTPAFSALVFCYAVLALRGERWPSAREWAALIPAGLVVFVLGYAIFLTNYNVQFTTTGIANRSAIAAALGAALCIVGAIGSLASVSAAPRVARVVFAALLAGVAGCGFLIVNTLAQAWVDAYRIERRTLADIQQRLPSMPPRSTLILDGVCPYVGPAIVFESNWDLAGALQVVYHDETLAADVVTPRLVVGAEGLTTRIYGRATTYPYGTALFVFVAGRGDVVPLPDAAAARAYFAGSAHARSCPAGMEGMGVRQ